MQSTIISILLTHWYLSTSLSSSSAAAVAQSRKTIHSDIVIGARACYEKEILPFQAQLQMLHSCTLG